MVIFLALFVACASAQDFATVVKDFVNTQAAGYIPAVNTMLAQQLASYDPYTIPATSPLQGSINLGVCTAKATATMTSGSVTGGKSIKVQNVSAGTTTLIGMTFSTEITFVLGGHIAGTAHLDATGSCSYLSKSTGVDATFSADIIGSVTVAMTADLVSVVDNRCATSLSAKRVELSHNNLKFSATTGNSIFDFFVTQVESYITPQISSLAHDLSNTLAGKTHDITNGLKSFTCPPTPPPTSPPAPKVHSRSPTPVASGLETFVNDQLVTLKTTLGSEMVAALKQYDPFSIPVPTSPFQKSLDLSPVCTLSATANATKGQVTGVSSMKVTAAYVTNSTGESFSETITTDLNVFVQTAIQGYVVVEAAATCGDFNSTSTFFANFSTTLEGLVRVRLTVDVLAAIQNYCVGKIEPLSLAMTYSPLDLKLGSSDPIFQPFLPIIVGYIKPVLDVEITKFQSSLDLKKLVPDSALAAITCKETRRPTSAPTSAPTQLTRINSAVSLSSSFGLLVCLSFGWYL